MSFYVNFPTTMQNKKNTHTCKSCQSNSIYYKLKSFRITFIIYKVLASEALFTTKMMSK